jgi:SAM-dependent methyltransferase
VTERALSFGAVAAAYERYRPNYPDELVDEVLAYAGGPVRTALEVGAGTGKATRVFAARGIAVTATDPDPAMLAELRRHVPATVEVVQGSFEDLRLSARYDLVFAAAAFHWTKPEGRWPRVAGMLRPGGVFASFGGQHKLADPELERLVEEVWFRYVPADDVLPDHDAPEGRMRWPGTDLEASELFSDVRQTMIRRRPVMTEAEYVGQLATVSAYLQLAPDVRERMLSEIRDTLPDRVEVDSDITLHLARTGA